MAVYPYPNSGDLVTAYVALLKSMPVGSAGTALLADVGGQAHAFPYLPENPGGITPFCGVDSNTPDYDLNGSASQSTKVKVIIIFWAARGSAGEADRMLDDLAQAHAAMLRKNFNARFFSPPITDYEEIDGKPYKFLVHSVEIDR